VAEHRDWKHWKHKQKEDTMGLPRSEEPRSGEEGAVESAGSHGSRRAQARESLTALDKAGQRARRGLQDAMAVLAREIDLEAAGKLARVRREYERGIEEKRRDELADDLLADLHEVEEELYEVLSRRLDAIVGELRSELQESRVQLGFDVALPGGASIELSLPEHRKKGIHPRDLLIGPMIGVVGIVTMNPILIAAGGSAVLVRGMMVLDRSRKERARKQLAEVSSDFQRRLTLILHQAIVETRSSLTSQLEEALDNRREVLLERVRTLGMQRESRGLTHRSVRLRDGC
jgi:hypothetical protein